MNNPFYYATVWRGRGLSLVGKIIDINEYLERLKDGESLHSFTGITATVCVISDDLTITREQKLDFAVMFMRGTYATISVNLKELTSTTEYGNPTPRY